MPTSNTSSDRGTTLVEVMIASAVLAISMVATLGAMTSSQTVANATKEETLALQLASVQMNFLRSVGFQKLEAMEGDSAFELRPDSGEGGNGNGNGNAYAYGHLKGKNGTVPTGLRRVTVDNGTLVVEVTVIWRSRVQGREMSRSLFWRTAP
jgi:prepilin-type N-terminal cleavage/methylation domain-containing protein